VVFLSNAYITHSNFYLLKTLSYSFTCFTAAVQAPSPSPSPSPSPAPNSPAPPTGGIPGVGSCGDTQPNVPGPQPFNCKSLGDFVPNENVTNVSPATGSVCCRPRLSCIDVDPITHGCQPFYCDTTNGWYPNQDALYRPNPSNEVCCKVCCCCTDVGDVQQS
jgi:hypothetical protein